MTDEITGAVSAERLLGNELARAAEALLAEANPEALEPAQALQLATVQVLLALYWELRHQRPGAPAGVALAGQAGTGRDPSLEWISALVCSGLPSAGRPATP